MKLNKNNIIKQLDDIFESQMKTFLDEKEWNEYEKLKTQKENVKKITGLEVKMFYKNDITNIDEFMIKHINNSKKQFKNALNENGKSIIVLYKKGRTCLVDGRWDKCEEYLINTKKGIRLGVYKEGLCGFIDDTGKIKVKPVYSKIKGDDGIITPIHEKMFWVKKHGNDNFSYGLVSCEGKELTPFEFSPIGKKFFKFGLKEYILGQTKKGDGVYSISNKKFIIPEGLYSKIITNTTKKIFIIKTKNNKFGVIKNDVVIVKPEYDQLNVLENNTFQVTKNKKIGVINEKGEQVIPLIYEKIVSYDKNNSELTLTTTENNNQLYDVFNTHGKRIRHAIKGGI